MLPRAFDFPEWFAEPGQYGVASAHQINAHLQQLELQRFISLHGLHNHKNLVHHTQSVLCGLRFDFAGTRRLSAPGGHLVGPGDILPTGS